MCNRVIIIANGKIVADDSIEHLKEVNTRKDRLVVSFSAPVSKGLLKQLKTLSSWEQVKDDTYKLDTANPEELRKELMEWSLKNELTITGMQTESYSLEDVFRVLTK